MLKTTNEVVDGDHVNIVIKKPFWEKNRTLKQIYKSRQLFILVLPALVYFIIFHYIPMYGVQIAFKDFIASKGIWGSPWVGLKHLNYFFESYYFWVVIKNTVFISLYFMVVKFTIPILLALMLNEVRNQHFKKIVQTVTYAPHFISMVVMVGMILAFLSPVNGIVNELVKAFGMEPIRFITTDKYFYSIYVWSGIWQGAGWESILYLAALAGIDPQLHESAIIDGASRIKRIWHIDLPGILPTIVILFILNIGSLMNVGFEKVFLMQNSLNLEMSEVISTYVYKVGLQQAQYSFSSAVGLFNSAINLVLLFTVNKIAKRVNETSLW